MDYDFEAGWTADQKAADAKRRGTWETANAPKHARDMTDAEFRAAVQAIKHPSRRPASPPSTPGTTSQTAPALAPAVGEGRHASTMTDAEYSAALAELTRRPARR